MVSFVDSSRFLLKYGCHPMSVVNNVQVLLVIVFGLAVLYFSAQTDVIYTAYFITHSDVTLALLNIMYISLICYIYIYVFTRSFAEVICIFPKYNNDSGWTARRETLAVHST